MHINDVVTGVLSALEQGRPGQRYVLGGENSSIVGVFKVVREITGRPPPRLHIPIWVAKIIGLVSVLVARLGGPVPIFTNTVRACSSSSVLLWNFCVCVPAVGGCFDAMSLVCVKRL